VDIEIIGERGSPVKRPKMSGPDRAKQMIEELQQEVNFRDKIIRKLELRILEKEEEILQLRSDLDKVSFKTHDYIKIKIGMNL